MAAPPVLWPVSLRTCPPSDRVSESFSDGTRYAIALAVTLPREILPNRTYLITRRCTQRQFLLRPDPKTNQIYLFCLALAAQRTGVEIVAFTAMSNHHHVVAHDPKGVLPDFLEQAHRLMARALNHRWGRAENLWATEQTCVTRLVESADVLRKVVYTLANPVADHLVENVHHWPGATSYHAMLANKTIEIERPRTFFRADGPVPARVTLEIAQPKEFGHLSREEWVSRVCDALRVEESAARRERERDGTRVVGRKAIRKASPFEHARSDEARTELRPTIACINPVARRAALLALASFHRAYERARRKLAAGKTATVFPAGTWQLRRTGLRCTAPP